MIINFLRHPQIKSTALKYNEQLCKSLYYFLETFMMNFKHPSMDEFQFRKFQPRDKRTAFRTIANGTYNYDACIDFGISIVNLFPMLHRKYQFELNRMRDTLTIPSYSVPHATHMLPKPFMPITSAITIS